MQTTTAKQPKVYVAVNADFNDDGVMIPKSLVWEDGTTYEIDRVTEIRQAAAMKAGGQGDRYKIYIRGKQSYLFFERSTNLSGNVIGRWFVERREAAPYPTATVRFANGGHGEKNSDGSIRRIK